MAATFAHIFLKKIICIIDKEDIVDYTWGVDISTI